MLGLGSSHRPCVEQMPGLASDLESEGRGGSVSCVQRRTSRVMASGHLLSTCYVPGIMPTPTSSDAAATS